MDRKSLLNLKLQTKQVQKAYTLTIYLQKIINWAQIKVKRASCQKIYQSAQKADTL